jgi:hypothetical protein
MRTLFGWLLLCLFLYCVVGVVFWWQWHSGVPNSHLASSPDDLHTFILVATRWPALVF